MSQGRGKKNCISYGRRNTSKPLILSD